jgi:AcrR family transcriptional regulator
MVGQMSETPAFYTKKPYHHGDLREALLVAGESALEDLPLEDVSLREIARRAGVSHAAPKHHFGSLGSLLGDVAARGFEQFVEALQSAADVASDQTPHSRLLAMGRAYLRFAAAHSGTYGLMFGKRDICETTPRLAKAMLNAWTQLEHAAGAVVGPSRAANGALLVWSTVHGMAMLKLDHKMPPHLDPNAGLEYGLRMLIAGMQSEGA